MVKSVPWSFLTNHAQVLVCLAADPDIRLREVGDAVGITERAAHRIVTDLIAAGYVEPGCEDNGRQRCGRRFSRSVYRVDTKRGTPMATLLELRREIDERMRRGASFLSIEDDVIDTSDLCEEQKSALWLYG